MSAKHGEVARIEVRSAEELRTRLFRERRPLILTNLFEGEPIRRITTMREALAVVGTCPTQIREEYVRRNLRLAMAYVRGEIDIEAILTERKGQMSTFNGYAELIARDPKTPLIVSEVPQPDLMAGLFTIPQAFKDFAPHRPVKSQCFMGNAGNRAGLHYDWDGCQVVAYQVFGRKRYTLLPPEAARKLNPVLLNSTVLLQNFTAEDRASFVEFARGVDVTLEPGEAIVMPAFVWHHIDYVDDAMSLNFRFGGNDYTDFFMGNVHGDWYGQNVISKLFMDPDLADQEYRGVFQKIMDGCGAIYASPEAKWRAMRALMRDICEEHCFGGDLSDYCFSNLDAIDAIPFYKANYMRTFATGLPPRPAASPHAANG